MYAIAYMHGLLSFIASDSLTKTGQLLLLLRLNKTVSHVSPMESTGDRRDRSNAD